MEKLRDICTTCDYRLTCKKPCAKVQKILNTDHVYERVYSDTIVIFPKKHERHFNEFSDDDLENFSDSMEWPSGDYELTQTRIFIEKFFNRLTNKELAERFGVAESVIATLYENCLLQIDKTLGILDMRATGLKNLKPDRFSEEEKMFLLKHIFKFNAREVAEMFHHSANYTSAKLNRMADKYVDAFSGAVM